MSTRGKALSERDQRRQRTAMRRVAKQVTLDAPFAGLPKGTVLFIGTPAILEKYIESVPYGEVRTLQRLRRDIARANQCQAMCPVSTALFLRMIAEVAWDEICDGRAAEEVTPFWRVIAPATPIAKRLRAPESWLRTRLELEQRSTAP